MKSGTGFGSRAVALVAAVMLAGCAGPGGRAQGPQVAAAPAQAALSGVSGVQPPADTRPFATALSDEQKYDMFLAHWVAHARNEDELFERGALAYGNVRTEYRARIESNHTPAQARAAVMPMIREWLAQSPAPTGRYSFQVDPMQLGQAGFQAGAAGLVLQAGWAGVTFRIDRPQKYADPRLPASRSRSEEIGRALWGNMFMGKPTILKITYGATSIRPVSLPLTPQQQYELNRAGRMRATTAGGYLAATKFRCSGGPSAQFTSDQSILKCAFDVEDQWMAPIVLQR